MTSRQLLKKQIGLVSVEMAAVMIFLLFMLLVCAEFGRMFYQYNELTKSVRNGTRYLSEHALSSSGQFEITASAIDKTKKLVVYGNTLGTGNAILPTLTTSDIAVSGDGTHVTVSAAWVYQSIWGTSLPTFGLSDDDTVDTDLTLQASLSMRALN